VENDYAIALPELDDDQILATDENGQELLYFAVNWGGKTVRLHYPRFAHWQKFCQCVLNILNQIGFALDEVDLDAATEDRDAWTDLAGRFLFLRDVHPKVKRAFFTYLRPTVDELDEKESRAWLTANAPLDSVVRMFCALLTPERMLKKNVRFAIQTICQTSAGQLSTPSSTSSGAGQKSEPISPQPWSSGFS